MSPESLAEPITKSAFPKGWLALRGCRLDGHVLPLTLLHPRIGVAILGGPPEAVALFRQRLDHACFFSIYAGHLPVVRLASAEEQPEAAFAGLPPLSLPGEDAWILTARRALEVEAPQGQLVQPSVRARRRRRRQRLILLAGAAAVIFGGIGIGVILPVVSAPLPLAAPLLPGPVAPATIASLPPVDPPPALTSAAIPAPPVSLARAGSDTTPRADAVVGEVVHRRVAPAEGARSAADNSLPALNGPPSTLSEAAMSSQAKPPLSGESTRTTSSPSMVPQMRAALLRRGKAMFALGDISSARLFFRRAAEGGSAIATTALGKTYDPGILTGIGVRGLRGDRATAAGWYQRAITLGDREAEELLAKLVP